jgi:tetratricopeptide (TPR) repeat protein/tRNA A-37 threonylcarbamoyl transferase component Bud32/DNA-directed RNA polymerase subunit RPC12/RpoP
MMLLGPSWRRRDGREKTGFGKVESSECAKPLDRSAIFPSVNRQRVGVMQWVCIKCSTPIEVPADSDQERLTCPKCGSALALNMAPTVVAIPDDVTYSGAINQRGNELASIGRFQILAQVGQGGNGIVLKAYDPQLRRLVALKIPRRETLPTSADRQRFFREARSASQLDHPSIVSTFDLGEAEGLPYIVGEFVEGSSLDKLLPGRRFSFRESAELVAAVADGLECAHRLDIIHRDIKPSNIMIDAANRPRIMDFGLARQTQSDATITQDGDVLGTPGYMSPEQAAGDLHQVDHRSDIYSLGIVLYQLLTGEPPFRGQAQMIIQHVLNDDPPNPRTLSGDIPIDLETICLKAIDKDPNRRYQASRELAEELRRWLRSEPILGRRIGRIDRAFRWCRRNPSLAAMTALAAGLLVCIAAGSTAAGIWISMAHKQQRGDRAAAERGLHEARQAFDQYYTLVSENPLLEVPANEPLLREILTNAINYCRAFLAQYGERPELDVEIATTYVRLAQLQLAVGESDAATVTMETADRRLETLLSGSPTLEQLAPLAAGVFRFPLYAQRRGAITPGNPTRGVAVTLHSVAIWDRLVADYPDVANLERDRAGMYYYLDLAYRANRDALGARRAIGKSIKILTRLTEQHPKNRTYRRDLSQYYSVLGDIDVAAGRLETGLKQQERAAAIDPSNPRPCDQVAVALSSFRDPKLRDPLRAVDFARKALAIAPSNPQYWHTLGVAQYRAGRWQAALESLENAMLLQNGGDGLDWYFVAMANWQVGNKGSARDYFRRAEEWKAKEHVGADDLQGLDREVAQLVTDASRPVPRDISKTAPNAVLPH